MDKNLFLNDKALFGPGSSRSIQAKYSTKNGSQTSRSHYNTSICEIDKGNNQCNKIMTDFIEQTRNRQSTFQFLDQRSKLSSNIIKHTQNSTTFRLKQSNSQYSRKYTSTLIPFEKQPTINSDEAKRQHIKDAEKLFLVQINGLNKQEVLSKMEQFIFQQLQEDFKELGSLYQVFMKEVEDNHLYLYKMQANTYKQSEVYQNQEIEEIIKQQQIEINYLKNKIEELKSDCVNTKNESTKIVSEYRDLLQNERQQNKLMKQKNFELENKIKNFKVLEQDNQAYQQKLQFYENKLQKLQYLENQGNKQYFDPQNAGNQKYFNQLNQHQFSKRSLSSNNTLNQDSYSLNHIEIHKEQIVEIRSVEVQIENDLLQYYSKDQEIQTDLLLLDVKYDDLQQEVIEIALDFHQFNLQKDCLMNLDDLIQQSNQEISNLPSGLDIFLESQMQKLNEQGNKNKGIPLNRQSIAQRQSIKPQLFKQIEFKQKQIIQFINFQKFRQTQLNSQIEELNQQLQENYINIDTINKLNQKLEDENLQLKLSLSELSGRLQLQKTNTQNFSEKLENISLHNKIDKGTNKQQQKEQQQATTVGKGPQLGQRITISYDFQKNQSKLLIEKVKLKKIGKVSNMIPLKLVLKYITVLYQEKIQSQKENKLLKDQDLASFIYNYYLKQFGYTKVTEQKFLILLISVQKNISVLRVNVFARFLGLLEETSNFTLEEQKKYLEALELVNSLTNFGTTIKNAEANAQQYVPYIRALSYLESLYYFKSQDKYAQLRSELDSIVEKDPSFQNRDGILDFDQMMLKVLRLFRENIKNIQTFVINAFNASDLDGNGMCQLEEWLTLNKYIESKKYDPIKLQNKFMENADLVCDGEKFLSFDRFSILCMELDIFSDNSQNEFLQVTSNHEVNQKFGLLRENWSFEYQNQLDKINQSQMEEEDKSKWLEILQVLDDQIVSNPEQKKPILIAWQIFLLETSQFFNQNEENQE